MNTSLPNLKNNDLMYRRLDYSLRRYYIDAYYDMVASFTYDEKIDEEVDEKIDSVSDDSEDTKTETIPEEGEIEIEVVE